MHRENLFTLPLVLLAAAVVSVPIARFARLSAIVACLVAGVIVGPYGLTPFSEPQHGAQALNEAAGEIIAEETEEMKG